MRRLCTLGAIVCVIAGCTDADYAEGLASLRASPAGAAQARALPRDALREPASVPPPTPFRPQPLYRLTAGRAMTCTSANALALLTAPGARERLGDVNYMQVAIAGSCVEIGNSHPILVCQRGPRFSFVAQWFGPGTASLCSYLRSAALSEQVGETFE